MDEKTNWAVAYLESPGNKENDEENNNGTTSSSSSSTLPTNRLEPFDEYDFLKKSSDIQLWINNLTTSSDYILENQRADCSTIVRIK